VLTFVVRRILYSVPVLLVASFILFCAVRLTFDPSTKLAFSRDPQAIERYRDRFGLNDPIPVQYFKWLGNVLRGDWGISSRTNGDVFPLVWRALGFTMQLIVWGILLAALLAIVIGVYAAVKQYSAVDYAITGATYVGLSMPPFWFGLLAVQFFVFVLPDWMGWDSSPFYFVGLHSTGQSGINVDYLRHLVLPVMTLTVQIVAEWSRYQRSAMLDVLHADYIRTARAKGVPRRRVIFRHGLRNALVPLLTVIAVQSGLLFGGLIITETIFSIPGMGRLFIQSLEVGDAYTLMAWFLVVAVFVIVFNLIADILYAVLDPRIRLS
jgi:peptide/nickel transport system permease protein